MATNEDEGAYLRISRRPWDPGSIPHHSQRQQQTRMPQGKGSSASGWWPCRPSDEYPSWSVMRSTTPGDQLSARSARLLVPTTAPQRQRGEGPWVGDRRWTRDRSVSKEKPFFKGRSTNQYSIGVTTKALSAKSSGSDQKSTLHSNSTKRS